MNAITPSGTRTREISIPFGRRQGARGVARRPRAGGDEGPDVHRHPLQDHQIVPVDHFVKALVPEPLLDLLRLRPPDLAQLRRVEVHEAPRELLAPGAPQEGHHLTRGEVPLDLDYA